MPSNDATVAVDSANSSVDVAISSYLSRMRSTSLGDIDIGTGAGNSTPMKSYIRVFYQCS